MSSFSYVLLPKTPKPHQINDQILLWLKINYLRLI